MARSQSFGLRLQCAYGDDVPHRTRSVVRPAYCDGKTPLRRRIRTLTSWAHRRLIRSALCQLFRLHLSLGFWFPGAYRNQAVFTISTLGRGFSVFGATPGVVDLLPSPRRSRRSASGTGLGFARTKFDPRAGPVLANLWWHRNAALYGVSPGQSPVNNIRGGRARRPRLMTTDTVTIGQLRALSSRPVNGASATMVTELLGPSVC